jgi:hypothetical protein
MSRDMGASQLDSIVTRPELTNKIRRFMVPNPPNHIPRRNAPLGCLFHTPPIGGRHGL